MTSYYLGIHKPNLSHAVLYRELIERSAERFGKAFRINYVEYPINDLQSEYVAEVNQVEVAEVECNLHMKVNTMERAFGINSKQHKVNAKRFK